MTTPSTNSAPAGKSGLRQLKAGEVLFNDGDVADSLFIIQKGQLRLFKPKGKGFIEITVLRTGEVLGEMAFFDEDGSGRKRSASAAAMVPTDVIEISFTAFAKTMSALNPWFKTIINTLATRLRKTNLRIKELESNSTQQYGSKSGEYEFLRSSEVIKVLSTLFLVYKSHGEKHELGTSIHKRTLDLYGTDIYTIQDVKFDAVLFALRDMGWLTIANDQDTNPYVFILHNLDQLRSLFIFYNTEKHLPTEKRMKISVNCEAFLDKIIQHATLHPPRDIQNLRPKDEYDKTHQFTQHFNLTPIIADFRNRGIPVNPDHLEDARNVLITGERLMQDGETLIEIDFPKLQKLHPTIKFMNMINKINREKAGT